jgi:transcriptional regulator of acetoin/glycerol metabolism
MRAVSSSLLDDEVFARRVAEVVARHRSPQPAAPEVRRKRKRRKKRTLSEIIHDGLREALRGNRWNVSAASRELGIARSSVQRLARRYGLKRPARR